MIDVPPARILPDISKMHGKNETLGFSAANDGDQRKQL